MTYVYALTIFHVLVSLLAIVAGIVVARAMLNGERPAWWISAFMITTGITLVTSFMFPYNGFTPAIGVGIICILIFLPTAYAWYKTDLSGIWGKVLVIGTMLLFYFNSFVLVVQSFLKVPFLNALAPNGNEPPFAIAQGILLVGFIVMGFLCYRRTSARFA